MKYLLVFTMVHFTLSTQAALPVWLQNQKIMEEVPTENTPDYFSSQSYLDAAPVGVGAKEAWSLPGGRGENVKIIDVEVGFESKHEDLGAVVFNSPLPKDSDHGTAVLGILRGLANGFGVTGIANQAQVGFYGFIEGMQDDVDQKYIQGINVAIQTSVNQLEAGDILVIEQHMNGPDANKYTAVEYWPEIFDELKKATDKGIHCVQAAGNGNSNFDSPSYNGAFDLKLRDSGCILVGAGAPQTHERLSFSNYGSRIDAHGYGSNVTTTGYGHSFNAGPTRKYTQRFSGTSSATPIVAGAVALVSSIAKANGKIISPVQMREALRATGTAQGKQTQSERIGNMPDIQALLEYLDKN